MIKFLKNLFHPGWEWKQALADGHLQKAFLLFRKRNPSLTAHRMAQGEFERLTGIVVMRRKQNIINFTVPAPTELPESSEFSDQKE